MFRPFFAFIGYRYTRIKRRNHFISFISLTSIIGVALGVSVLITVLSVMNGFNKEIRKQMLNGTPHVTVGKVGQPLKEWQVLNKELKDFPKVQGSAPFILGQGMLTTSGNGGSTSNRVHGTLVKGIDPTLNEQVYPLTNRMKAGDLGSLKAGAFNIILGKTLAENLNVELGDKISLILPEALVTPAGVAPRIRRFTVTGIVSIGDLYDGSQVLVHVQDAGKLFHLQGGVTGLQLKMQDELKAPSLAKALYQHLNQDQSHQVYFVTDWTGEFGSFFKALNIQKTVMMFILLLIIAVAAFNLVSSLVMMVTDKRGDIAILRTLGATRANIMGIFMAQGSVIGAIGTVLGVIFGIYMAMNVTAWTDFIQQKLNVELVAKDVYLVGFLPSEIRISDVLFVTGLTLVMCFTATIYPAWKAASIKPAEALRYE